MRRTGLKVLARRGDAAPAIESLVTRVGGVDVHARVTRDAPPDAPVVILVHGLVVSSRYMMPLARVLAPEFRVLAPDLPGFGKSGKPREVLDVPGLARALADWMEEVGIERASLIGNSFGCQTIVELGVRHPGRVERAVLQGPTVDPHARNFLAQFWRWYRDGKHEATSEIPILVRDYWDAGVRRSLATIRAMLADTIETKLPRFEAPALVVRGALDPIVPQAWAEEAASLLPRGRLVVLPGVAHTINFTAPLELARVARPFLLGDSA